jgi:hypothetical protein
MSPRWLWFFVLVVAVGIAGAQHDMHSSTPTGPKPFDNARMLSQPDAVNLVQAINVTESEIFSRTHKYAPLEKVFESPMFKERKALPAPPGDAGLIKDHYLRLLVSPDGSSYMVSVTPQSAGCDYAVFSDNSAAIYPVGALGECDD